MGHWENNPKNEIHSIRGLSQNKTKQKRKKKKAEIKNLTSHLKELKKNNKQSPK